MHIGLPHSVRPYLRLLVRQGKLRLTVFQTWQQNAEQCLYAVDTPTHTGRNFTSHILPIPTVSQRTPIHTSPTTVDGAHYFSERDLLLPVIVATLAKIQVRPIKTVSLCKVYFALISY